MPWFDGHLDLTYIADHGRDLTADSTVPQVPTVPQVGTPPCAPQGFLSFPALRRAAVTHAISTIFVRQKTAEIAGPYAFATPDQAFAAAVRQIGMHKAWEAAGHLAPIVTRASRPLPNDQQTPILYALAMEGAAPLRTVDDLPYFLAAGVRMISLAWAEGSPWAGGDQSGGDLTPAGRQLVPLLDAAGIIHDVSHLSEKAFWSLLEIATGPIVASHSNCRALLPGSKFPERHLSDEQILALANRRQQGRPARIGLNLFARFLIPPNELATRRATIHDAVQHLDHIAQLTGSTDLLCLGSDMDSGFGPDLLPSDLQRPEHLPRLAEALAQKGWTDAQIQHFQFDAWQALLNAERRTRNAER